MNTVTEIAGSLANSAWQGAALAVAVWTAMRTARQRVNAATRHLIWWIALACVFLLPCIHWRAQPAPAPRKQLPVVTAASLPVRVPAPFGSPPVKAAVTVAETKGATWPFWLLAIWSAACAWKALGILRGYLYLREVKRRAVVWDRPLPILNRRAQLLFSNDISSPVSAGYLHPAVILPEKLREQLTNTEIDHILLHESAHLSRYDDWENLAARLAGMVLALHPVVWWILREIEHERETACDEWAVAQTGAARSYAKSLVRIAEFRLNPRHSVLASSMCARPSRLRRRIETLLLPSRWGSPNAARIPLAGAAAALACLSIAGALAPHWIVFAQKLEFEVASVKKLVVAEGTYPAPLGREPVRSGTLFTWHNMRAGSMIHYAYHLNGNYQLVGYDKLPDSLSYAWYTLDARAPEGATDDQVRLMLQSMLEDRFKLKVHRETRDLTEYELSVAGGKPKLTPSSGEPMNFTIEGRKVSPNAGTCIGTLWRTGEHMTCHGATTETIGAFVGGVLHSPVADYTGLTGTYDLDVLFTPDNQRLQSDADPDVVQGPTLEKAIEESLGLKLEKGKGPVEVIVIDHMEQPSEN